jgi:RimJ/RimL family protein N-acetyltransferase
VADHNAAPALETARLMLRRHRVQDFDALHAMWSEPEIYRCILGRPPTREESWSRLLRYAGHWTLMGFGYWAVEDRLTSTFLGELGFADYHRDITPSLDETPELGWALTTASHGKGYATEALLAVTAWGDLNLNRARTACIIAPANTASIRVAEKIGFHEAARITYKSEPTLLYYRPLNSR